MKITMSCLLAIIFVCFIGPIYSHSLDKKLYVNPNTVHVMTEGIFIELENGFFPVKAIGKDEHGIYAITDGVRWVTCSKCDKDYDRDNQSSKCPHDYTAMQ